jgi:hypothetical protein
VKEKEKEKEKEEEEEERELTEEELNSINPTDVVFLQGKFYRKSQKNSEQRGLYFSESRNVSVNNPALVITQGVTAVQQTERQLSLGRYKNQMNNTQGVTPAQGTERPPSSGRRYKNQMNITQNVATAQEMEQRPSSQKYKNQTSITRPSSGRYKNQSTPTIFYTSPTPTPKYKSNASKQRLERDLRMGGGIMMGRTPKKSENENLMRMSAGTTVGRTSGRDDNENLMRMSGGRTPNENLMRMTVGTTMGRTLGMYEDENLIRTGVGSGKPKPSMIRQGTVNRQMSNVLNRTAPYQFKYVGSARYGRTQNQPQTNIDFDTLEDVDITTLGMELYFWFIFIIRSFNDGISQW